MEAVDLLCSRYARPEKDGMGSLVVLLLAERARSEGARSTRAFEDQPGYPVKRKASELGRIGKQPPDRPSCSQNAHDETVLVQCAH